MSTSTSARPSPMFRPAASATFDVVGVGNALVDALVRMEERELLGRLGIARGHSTPVDHARWQSVFHEIQVHGVSIRLGGSGANSIATLGYMGARTLFCGQVGDDQLGHLYAKSMEEACGGHALHWTRSANTGKCLSIISTVDAERTMLTDLGAAVALPTLGTFDEQIRAANVLHVEGYLLLGDPMLSRAQEAMAIAAQEEIIVSLDVSDPFVVTLTRDKMVPILEELVDVVFMNEEEARRLVPEAQSPEAALDWVAARVDTAVLKLGGRGSMVAHKGQRVAVGVHPVTAVDTTGAGDCYAAGFLYGYVRGWDPARAADLAARVAALAVGQVGAVVQDREALARAIAAAQGA